MPYLTITSPTEKVFSTSGSSLVSNMSTHAGKSYSLDEYSHWGYLMMFTAHACRQI